MIKRIMFNVPIQDKMKIPGYHSFQTNHVLFIL